jgi:hypothetical protein
MFHRSLKIRSVVGIGAAVAAFAIAAPLATADPAPLFIPQHRQVTPRPGEGLSGADRSWLSLKQTTPRLGEGWTPSDRKWLTPTSTERHVASPSNPFNWGDAGIGAGTAAAAFLLLSGSAVVIRRRLSPAH